MRPRLELFGKEKLKAFLTPFYRISYHGHGEPPKYTDCEEPEILIGTQRAEAALHLSSEWKALGFSSDFRTFQLRSQRAFSTPTAVTLATTIIRNRTPASTSEHLV